MDLKKTDHEKRIGVAAFAFGEPHDITSNLELAKMAEKVAISHDSRAAIFTQLDIQFENEALDVARVAETPGEPPPTLKIAREAVLWALERKIDELHIVAAEPHVWRVRRDLEAALEEADASIKIGVCSEIYQHPEGDWFCPNSKQSRTKSKMAWNLREWLLRYSPLRFFSLYKLIASGGSKPLSKISK